MNQRVFGPRQNDKGFTLLELLVAAATLVLAITLMIGASVDLRKANEIAGQVETALQDAQRLIEQMRQDAANGTFPNNVTLRYPENRTLRPFNNLDNERVTIDYVNSSANPLNATVTVSWDVTYSGRRGGSVTRVMSRQLTTLLTNRR